MNNSAVGYVRISILEQSIDGLSLATQEKGIRNHCALNNLELTEILYDYGAYNNKMHHCPGLQKAIRLAKKQQSALVVNSLSKLAHSSKNAISIAKALNESGANLICINESWDTTTPTGRNIFKILEDLARFETEALSIRTKEALANKRINSEFSGQTPYGMMRGDVICSDDPGRPTYELIENPLEIEVLNLVSKMRAEGTSFRLIAEHLNSLGLRTRRKTRWRKDRVWQLYQSIKNKRHKPLPSKFAL